MLKQEGTPRDQFQLSSSPIFILRDSCYWGATYFDMTKVPIDNICPKCNVNNNELTSFPIMSNESFTYIAIHEIGRLNVKVAPSPSLLLFLAYICHHGLQQYRWNYKS